jgi:hypothetical protein
MWIQNSRLSRTGLEASQQALHHVAAFAVHTAFPPGLSRECCASKTVEKQSKCGLVVKERTIFNRAISARMLSSKLLLLSLLLPATVYPAGHAVCVNPAFEWPIASGYCWVKRRSSWQQQQQPAGGV